MSTATENHVVRDDQYNYDAFALLKKTFPLISVAALQRTFREKHYSFTASYDILQSIQVVVNDEALGGFKEKRLAIIAIAPFLDRVSTIVLKSRRRAPAGIATGRNTSLQLLHEIEGKWKR